MATFPALAPATRVFVPGTVPQAIQSSLSGASTGFRRGNRRIGQTLNLTFTYLTEAQMNLIKDHYFASQGSYQIFFLSAEIWGDYATPPVPLISDFAWLYAGAPAIEDVSYDRFTVSVELQTIPIDPGDLVFDGELAPASPARSYILNAGAAAATPARDYVINPLGAS
jgi:hypothetical protein